MKVLLIAAAVLGVPEPVRDTSFDWRCVGPANEIVSEHQRQDKAIVACQNAARLSPGSTYYVEGGRYRVTAEAVPACEMPDAWVRWDGGGVDHSTVDGFRLSISDTPSPGSTRIEVPPTGQRLGVELSFGLMPGTHHVTLSTVASDGTETPMDGLD